METATGLLLAAYMNTMYKTIYVIQGDRVVKGELRKVVVDTDGNTYHDITLEAPNIEFFENEKDAKTRLREKLQEDLRKIGEKLEEL